jgi:hypothetical protein
MYPVGYYMEFGGFIAYAHDFVDAFRRLAGYVDQSLKGSLPADIPFYQAVNFNLIIVISRPPRHSA